MTDKIGGFKIVNSEYIEDNSKDRIIKIINTEYRIMNDSNNRDLSDLSDTFDTSNTSNASYTSYKSNTSNTSNTSDTSNTFGASCTSEDMKDKRVYYLGRTIGENNKMTTKYVIKNMEIDKETYDADTKEFEIYSYINHYKKYLKEYFIIPVALLAFYESKGEKNCKNPFDGQLFLVFDFWGETLENYCGQIRPCQITDIFVKMSKGISYLHVLKYAHTDIKPSNILVKIDGNYTKVKIIDFDLAISFKNENKSNNITGSPLYSPPELLDQALFPDAPPYSPRKVDSWSIGMTILCVCFGCERFYRNEKGEEITTIEDLHTTIMETDDILCFPDWLRCFISDDINNWIKGMNQIIRKLFAIDFKERLSVSNLVKILDS